MMEVSIVIPPMHIPGVKQDARSWLNWQRSLGKTDAEIREAFLALPAIEGEELKVLVAEQKANAKAKKKTQPGGRLENGCAKPEATYKSVAPGTMVKAGDRDNYGTVVSDDGDFCTVHFVSPSGNEATKSISKSELSLQDGSPLAESTADQFPKVMTLGQMAIDYPSLKKPVIEGLLREGETLNLISVSKVGKSWLVADLALAAFTGRQWLGSFDIAQGNVLVLDNELHPETLNYRFKKVGAYRMIPPPEYAGLQVASFRGRLSDIFVLEGFFNQFKPGDLRLIVIDALYRFWPASVDENSNTGITSVYNALDRYAAQLNCAIVCVHHASKGNQSGKSVVDVGSGAGAQSRAADIHLVLRPHREDNAVVMEAAVRSFPPLEPRVLRWMWPVWELATDLDATDLRSERSQRGSQQADIDAMKKNILDSFRQFENLTATKTQLRDRCGARKVFDAAWLVICQSGYVVECEVQKGNSRKYKAWKCVFQFDNSEF